MQSAIWTRYAANWKYSVAQSKTSYFPNVQMRLKNGMCSKDPFVSLTLATVLAAPR